MKEVDLNAIDRFLYKLLICSFLLFAIVILDKINVVSIDKMQVELSEHFNMLTVIKAINGDKGVLLPIDISDQVSLTNSRPYLESQKISNGRRVILDEMNGIENYKAGIVVKIYQNDDKTFEVTVKGVDGYNYVYNKLSTVDCNIYKVLSSGDIIGLPTTKNNENYFEFYVYDKGKVVDVIS